MVGLAGFLPNHRYRSQHRGVARQVMWRTGESMWAVSGSTASWTDSRCSSKASTIASWPTSTPTTTMSRAATRKRWSCSGAPAFRRHSAEQSSVQSISLQASCPRDSAPTLQKVASSRLHFDGIVVFLCKVQLFASAIGVLDGGGVFGISLLLVTSLSSL